MIAAFYGRNNPLGTSCRPNILVPVPAQNTILLEDFVLQRTEFNEMIAGSRFEKFSDLIWQRCSAHNGVASRILITLNYDYPENEKIDDKKLLHWLHSDQIFRAFHLCRGFVCMETLHKIGVAYELEKKVMVQMYEILAMVAQGKEVRLSDIVQSQGGDEAVDFLLQIGFLIETSQGFLEFASKVHLIYWQLSSHPENVQAWIDYKDRSYFH
jgi:hypothetical protein